MLGVILFFSQISSSQHRGTEVRLAPGETPEIKPSAFERRLTGQCAWGFRQNMARRGWSGSRTGPRWAVEVMGS